LYILVVLFLVIVESKSMFFFLIKCGTEKSLSISNFTDKLGVTAFVDIEGVVSEEVNSKY